MMNMYGRKAFGRGNTRREVYQEYWRMNIAWPRRRKLASGGGNRQRALKSGGRPESERWREEVDTKPVTATTRWIRN